MTAALEEIKIVDIEEWKTLNTAASPTKLEKGMTPNAKNVWVDEKPGSVITANGYIKVGTIPSNNPVTFCINYFKTATGIQTFIVSDNATVWTTLDFQHFTSIITGLSAVFQLRGLVIRDKLWLTNGSDAVITFDGATVTVLDGTAGTPNVPKGKYIAYHDERVWMFHTSSARSQVTFSALTDSSGTIINPDTLNAWGISSNTIQVSEGDADFGTGMFLYRGYLYFSKQLSIWRLTGYDEYTYTRTKTRASTGTIFNESIQVLDSLIHLIGIDGLYVFDGEETVRISDIIDPADSSQVSFGFDFLQQLNVNNQFWETTNTADWNLGTVSANLSVNNEIVLVAADDSQADFAAGATLTNMDTSSYPGTLKLSRTSAGTSSDNLSSGQTAVLSVSSPLIGIFGQASYVTDGDLTNAVGGIGSPSLAGSNHYMQALIPFAVSATYVTVILKGVTGTGAVNIEFTDYNGNILGVSAVSAGASLASPLVGITATATPTNYTITLNATTSAGIAIRILVQNHSLTFTEMQVFGTAYNATGKFTSKTLNLGLTPASLGTFSVSDTLNGETLTFFTQSSADGAAWDAEVAVTNGGSIASTPRQYLRWGANFVSDGLLSPTIDAAYLPSVYLSIVHDTGGSIYSWGPFESDYALAAQTVKFYYRTGTTSPNCLAASWNLIVPGGVVNDSVSNQFIQFKIEFSGGDSTHLPEVISVTINWVKGVVGQTQVLQNVASWVWRNRYWLSAASSGATANNTILVRGKKTFGSPWQLKDWPILSFTRYQDALYGGSSADGSIYQLDSGFSANGSALDSFFETGDFTFGGFYVNVTEVGIEVERTGPYNLSVGISKDRGNTYTEMNVDLTTSTYAPSYIKRLNFNITTDRFRMRVRISGADRPFQVHALRAYYTMESSRGSIK